MAVLLAAGITVGIISLKGKKADPDNGSSISQSLTDKENNKGGQKLVPPVSQDGNTVSDNAVSDGENNQSGRTLPMRPPAFITSISFRPTPFPTGIVLMLSRP